MTGTSLKSPMSGTLATVTVAAPARRGFAGGVFAAGVGVPGAAAAGAAVADAAAVLAGAAAAESSEDHGAFG
jgi:hypothetical protein